MYLGPPEVTPGVRRAAYRTLNDSLREMTVPTFEANLIETFNSDRFPRRDKSWRETYRPEALSKRTNPCLPRTQFAELCGAYVVQARLLAG